MFNEKNHFFFLKQPQLPKGNLMSYLQFATQE
jgi:hypothetical protein